MGGRVIVDIKQRTTEDKDKYQKYLKSMESYIYLDKDPLNPQKEPLQLKDGETASLDFTVGERWFNLNDSRWYTIPQDGIVLKSNEGATFETKEHIALPLNMFGVVTGIGRHIYVGGMTFPGKIDPGFSGRLRVGFYNSSKTKKLIKPGDTLCACYFLQMEETIANQFTRNAPEPTTGTPYNRKWLRVKSFWRTYWDKVLSISIALLSVIVVFYVNFFLKK